MTQTLEVVVEPDAIVEKWWAEVGLLDRLSVADLIARVRADERDRAAGYMVEELGTRIVRQYGRIEDGDVAEDFGRGLYRAVQIAEQVRNDLVRRPHLAAIREGGA